MRVPTIMGLAFVNMAAANPKTTIGKHIFKRVQRSDIGTKKVKPVHVSCSERTRQRIMVEQGVDVYA